MLDLLTPNPQPENQGGAQSTSFRWEPQGKAVTVYVDFDVVDRLGFDIMRGLGAVPRRGAEVGGILLGSTERGDRTVIRIEDYVAVDCEHARGPSYVLSEKDMRGFEEALGRWAPAPDKRIYAVGYYRSNTRDTFQLSPEDLSLLESRFQESASACLLVKPYATRASEAVFHFREGGKWPSEDSKDVFPFRRKELGGGKPPRRPRSAEDADSDLETAATGFSLADEAPQPAGITAPALADSPAVPQKTDRSKFRGGWVWIPLSFVFLLLGVVLGTQITMSFMNRKPPEAVADPYLLDLTVAQFGDNIHLKWNTEAAAFRNAKRGVLEIQDGDNSKTVELKPEDLSRGGALYRNATGNLKFRLEVFPRERNSVSESVELHLIEQAKPTAEPTAEQEPKAEAKPEAKPAAKPAGKKNGRRKQAQ